MQMNDMHDWLWRLRARYATVAIWMDLNRAKEIPDPDLSPRVLLGLIEHMAERDEKVNARISDFIARHANPPAIIVSAAQADAILKAGAINRIEPPAAAPPDIYLVDYLRSLWTRIKWRFQ
jgi:hypothetical protein